MMAKKVKPKPKKMVVVEEEEEPRPPADKIYSLKLKEIIKSEKFEQRQIQMEELEGMQRRLN